MREVELTNAGELQQCLPLAVLKPSIFVVFSQSSFLPLQQCLPLAVLKHKNFYAVISVEYTVATVLTACGIETATNLPSFSAIFGWLQQCLPLAVLKQEVLSWNN